MTYISIKQILDDLLADDMMKGLSLERAVNYAVEFLKVIGMPPLFDSKVACIEIHNYRGLLPCDLYEITQVKGTRGIMYLAATDSFPIANTPHKVPMLSYVVKDDVIFTSTKEDNIEVAYTAIRLDENSFPLIPDKAEFIRALELYIQKRYFTILFNSSKISREVLQNTQQEYAFYAGQAQTALVNPNLDNMEDIKNMWNTMIPKIHKHSDGFRTMVLPEVTHF